MLPQTLFRGCCGSYFSVLHDDERVGDGKRLPEIMQDEDDGPALVFQLQDHLHELALSAQIKVCGRLVEYDVVTVLRERHGEKGALADPAGQGVRALFGIGTDVCEVHGALHDRNVFGAFPARKTQMRKSAVLDERSDRQRGDDGAHLRQKGEPARALPRWHGEIVRAVQRDPARRDFRGAVETLEQGCLAAAVWTDDGRDPA